MRNKQQLHQLAQQHGVRTTKRVFFDTVDPHTRQKSTSFLDVPRPPREIVEELTEKGVLPSPD